MVVMLEGVVMLKLIEMFFELVVNPIQVRLS
jgi:hypothetical protein